MTLDSRLIAVFFFAVCGTPCLANPTGGTVIAGSATIQVNGSTLTVANTSDRAIINWQNFSIGQNEQTRFVQPSATSAVLNRVVSSTPSSILGSLTSNGAVFLINPNGVIFGAGSQVSAASLSVSTGALSDANFLAGNFSLGAPGSAGISVQGSLNSTGSMSLNGGDIIVGGNLTFGSGTLTTPGQLTTSGVVASTGSGNVSLTGGNVTVGGTISSGGSIALSTPGILTTSGNVTSTGSGNVSLTGGNVTAGGTINSGGSVAIGGTVSPASTVVVTAASLALGQNVTKGPAILVGGKSVDLNVGAKSKLVAVVTPAPTARLAVSSAGTAASLRLEKREAAF